MKAALLVLALLVAGCGTPTDSTDSTSTTDTTTTDQPLPPPPCCPEAKVRELQLACTAFYGAFQADGERVAARLPPGYTAGTGPAIRTQVVLFSCESITLDNTTVLRDVHLMTVPVPVGPPNAVDGEFADVYSLETATDNPALAAVLNSWGFASVNATFAWDESSPLAALSLESDAFAYDLQLAGEGSTGNDPFQSEVRYQSGTGTWFDALHTVSQNPIGAVAGVLDGEGLVPTLAIAPPPVPLDTAKSVVQETWTFGPQT
ncbi:MAG: hypothetical protein QOD77_1661 [Thermoplasmata archaeon]|jgi:hypothetical protein|nr:hypothetical protein [Thermoplasmata archaeon]